MSKIVLCFFLNCSKKRQPSRSDPVKKVVRGGLSAVDTHNLFFTSAATSSAKKTKQRREERHCKASKTFGNVVNNHSGDENNSTRDFVLGAYFYLQHLQHAALTQRKNMEIERFR